MACAGARAVEGRVPRLRGAFRVCVNDSRFEARVPRASHELALGGWVLNVPDPAAPRPQRVGFLPRAPASGDCPNKLYCRPLAPRKRAWRREKDG
jgi:hypothetical protein